jgi:hypothetical protein
VGVAAVAVVAAACGVDGAAAAATVAGAGVAAGVGAVAVVGAGVAGGGAAVGGGFTAGVVVGSDFDAHPAANDRRTSDATTNDLIVDSVYLVSIFCMRSISVV